MRVKKQKRHRRAVRFYTACFGVRQPYKVLCDGTFIHHLIVHNIAPADTAISNILGGSVKLFTTRCVLAELKRLGKSYSNKLRMQRVALWRLLEKITRTTSLLVLRILTCGKSFRRCQVSLSYLV
ncbi:hypothetical protein OIU76_030336 [Salix suchowensis]|nr:hypothetical protein OIU76_030336 [Salix suchowensis]